MTQGMKMGRKIGAVMGAIVFLIFGLAPGFYFGSYGTLVVISHLVGGPVEPNIIVRMFIVVGVLLGLFCIASVSIVLGAAFGSIVGYATEALTARPKELAAAEVKE